MRLLLRGVLPRRTVRLRLTVLYGGLFVVCGALLLAISSGVAVSSSRATESPAPPGSLTPLQQDQNTIQNLRDQLASAQSAAHSGLSHGLVLGAVVALGVMTVVAVLLGWIMAGRVLRPLQQMTAATRRISADSLHERLDMPGPGDELKDLADTIDGLLARLEGAFAAQRRFVANASHELRTPLTTMRAAVDVAVAKPGPVAPQTIVLADRLRGELDRVDGLLDGFLALARAQHGDLPGLATLSLEYLTAASLAVRAEAIAARHLTVHHVTGTDGTWVAGSQALLCRMVDNVLDNAIRHNREGGWISVSTGAEGRLARVLVETGGDVLDQEQVSALAQPFRRLGADRTGSDGGSGLGLSIVEAIAVAHCGTLDLHARPEGGLAVSIALPLAAAEHLAGAGAPA